jgi:hypothetical protein
MTIGIAIPTYVGHLYNLKDLLYQISKSTVLPSQVSVSISSFDGDLELPEYPFELIVTKTIEHRNTSQNCNISASKLSTDIISFFGGDDLPHIKRNEFILKAFEKGCDAVVHDYTNSDKTAKEFIDDIGDIQLFLNHIDTYVSELHFPVSSINKSDKFANGTISISKEIFDKFKYGETEEFNRREDSMYNSNLIKNGYKISYIKNSLMLYIH